MEVTPGHLFAQLDLRDIEESDERVAAGRPAARATLSFAVLDSR